MNEERKIEIEEVEAVPPPPKARVSDASRRPARRSRASATISKASSPQKPADGGRRPSRAATCTKR